MKDTETKNCIYLYFYSLSPLDISLLMERGLDVICARFVQTNTESIVSTPLVARVYANRSRVASLVPFTFQYSPSSLVDVYSIRVGLRESIVYRPVTTVRIFILGLVLKHLGKKLWIETVLQIDLSAQIEYTWAHRENHAEGT